MARPPRTRVLPGGIGGARMDPTVHIRVAPVHHHHTLRHRHATRLHIGCGSRRLAGWVNADAAPGVGDVVFDLHETMPEATYHEIYGSHVLEHCWPADTPGILKRLHDALVPGGTLRLSVPDLRLIVANCVDSNVYGDERSALSVLFGGTFSKTTSAPDLHRQAFWKERLERLLSEAGFVNVREWGRGQYPAIDALKDFATFPFDYATGKSTISLNLEADRAGELVVEKPVATGGAGVDISVLLGTVDRPMLLDCIEAVRSSLHGSGFTYEIVVAYGNENDQSLSWLRSQPDVVAILGGMDGAIEAFNRAYAASRGRLICQINDDVLVDGESIARAAKYLDANASSSGVIFKFDRGDGKGYRHEHLGHTIHPNQMVVRREVCEAVVERIGAFWGDEKHRTDKTYGGDSAFGVLCCHLGLRLDSVEGVTCRDLLAPDTLRAQNKAAVSSQHPSRWAAMYQTQMETFAPAATVDEWPNCYVPRPGMPPRRSPLDAGRPLRILALPIIARGWPQTGLRNAFAKIGPYAEVVHDGNPTRAMVEAARQHQPDVVWAQVQNENWQEISRALRDVVGPDCTMTQWTGDVRTDGHQPVARWLVALAESYDILLADNCGYPKKLAHEGVRAGYLSCGIESELLWEPDAAETGGAVFIGMNYSRLDGCGRQALFNSVTRALPGTLTVYGDGWQGHNTRKGISVVEAGQISRRASITICKSLYSTLERYTSNRLKNACFVGAVPAVERFADMAGLGMEPGKNCLVWSGVDELIALLSDWTRPERAAERQAIRERAHELAERFTWERSVEGFLAIVRDFRARKGQPC